MSVDSNTSLDPRIQIELEKLNFFSDNINKFEVELEILKKQYEELESEGIEKIKKSSHKITNAIETSEEYYKTRISQIQLQKEFLSSAANYEKAKTHLSGNVMKLFIFSSQYYLLSHFHLSCKRNGLLSRNRHWRKIYIRYSLSRNA